jgi:hypothetical protein
MEREKQLSMCAKMKCLKESCNSSEPKLCEQIMCLGTPDEIAKLIDAGYIGVLRLVPATMIAVNAATGRPIGGKRLWMLQLAIDDNGCVMHKDGECLLSGLGLTPEIGKRHLAGDTGGCEDMYERVMRAWDDPSNGQTIIHCLESLLKHSEKSSNHLN